VEHEPHLRHGEAKGGRDLLVSVYWAFVGWALGTIGEVGRGTSRPLIERLPALLRQWPLCPPQNVLDDRGEASVMIMYFLLARGEQIVFLEGEQP
jgi:hypothetical protein